MDLHLKVIAHAYRQGSRLALSRNAEHRTRIRRVLDGLHVALGIGIDVGIIKTITGGTEIGSHAIADRRSEHMTHGDQLVAEHFLPQLRRQVHTVQFRIGANAQVVVIDAVETIYRIAHCLHLVIIP